jgi:hypothetical protein
MGYGEVGGGGSVKWQMVHGGSGGGSGYDPNPPAGAGRFIVKLDTVPGTPPTMLQFPIQETNRHQIQIVWVPASAVPENATQAQMQTALNNELNVQKQELTTRGAELGQAEGRSSAF